MLKTDRAFEVDEGIIIQDGAGFFSGAGSPVGSQAPLNSIYRDSQSLDVWKKVGPLDTEWELQAQDITVFKCFRGGDSGNLAASSSAPCTRSGGSDVI